MLGPTNVRASLTLALVLGHLASAGCAIRTVQSSVTEIDGHRPGDVGSSGSGDAAIAGDTYQPPPEPLRILFIGNNLTSQGRIPSLVDQLAIDAAWPDPDVQQRTFGGETLEGHRGRTETLEAIDQGDWDVVVLQELSTRATDNVGDPTQFKLDVTWFHDRIKPTSPGARIILFEPWARHPDHADYPGDFADPAEMQAQLRFHHNDAVEVYLPANATETVSPPAEVAAVGDAWEHHLAEPDALRLHDTDDLLAGEPGQYLTALIIYATIYERATVGLTPWELPPAEGDQLQVSADGFTGHAIPGGPTGEPRPLGLLPGEIVRVDLGDAGNLTAELGWTDFANQTDGSAGNLVTTDGDPSTVDLEITVAFGGINTSGIAANDLGYPGAASADSFFCGSANGHDDGLLNPGQARLTDLDPDGLYTLRLFAARSGDDGGLGRLTRYSVGVTSMDIEVSDNTGDRAVLTDLAPAVDGSLIVDVGVSPAGTGRYCYMGVLELERQ